VPLPEHLIHFDLPTPVLDGDLPAVMPAEEGPKRVANLNAGVGDDRPRSRRASSGSPYLEVFWHEESNLDRSERVAEVEDRFGGGAAGHPLAPSVGQHQPGSTVKLCDQAL